MPSPTVLEAICDTYEVQPNEILEWCKDDRQNLNLPATATKISSQTRSLESSPKSQSQPKRQTEVCWHNVA